ncbi:post-GPI attachment to proteins factor 6-like [Copidosoma floridanum]|uniref:post-GPI attachment to proteins factor 6-like n=1 Tax=Copidosoma floridanum TaxID=29053 RepID=UPI0006C96766|nr:post-GPI attachment to proteins factor 6-like [Copidosoma floridanum]XP_014218413.1 post-GPI attachment to proteins factor 6-like [Copidosoma floridanum]
MGPLQHRYMMMGLIVLAWASLHRISTLASTTEIIARQPDNELYDFLGYEYVTVVHFVVPEGAVSVGFKFISTEEKVGGVGKCYPRNVTINFKSGSLPLVSPDGSKIETKVLPNRRRIYTIESQSNDFEHLSNIPAPPPGDWYVIAYRSWVDPNDEQIKQAGLAASCKTVLEAEMSIEHPDFTFSLGPNASAHSVQLTRQVDSSVTEFRVPRNTNASSLTLNSTCAENCSISVHVTAADLVFADKLNATSDTYHFRGFNDGSLHYVTLRLESGNASDVTLELVHQPADPGLLQVVKLTRKTLPDFFMFDYDHLSPRADNNEPFNLTAGSLALLRFQVGPVYDTGGTLSISMRLAEEEEDQSSIRLVGCLSLGYYSTVGPMGSCHGQKGSRTADVYSRNHSSPDVVYVPYPEPGTWYLTIRAFGVANASGCECFEDCALNGTGCGEPACDCVHGVDARIETIIQSSFCVDGHCGDHGVCVKRLNRGSVVAACHCTGGYRGFDCADDAYVMSDWRAVTSIVLLTCSNVAFVGAVVAAIKRHYYTEALVYGTVMFFSTFYHACDAADEEHSFCLFGLSLNVLQFGDFYSALLAIWLTLVAMASMGRRVTSFCQMLGVIVLAMGAEMDRMALWVFLLPAFFGFGLVVVSWALKCRQKGTLAYPARAYRLFYLPAGLVIVLIGLVCFAFLQTRSNYYIVHSVWHVCVAVGAALLLPSREHML